MAKEYVIDFIKNHKNISLLFENNDQFLLIDNEKNIKKINIDWDIFNGYKVTQQDMDVNRIEKVVVDVWPSFNSHGGNTVAHITLKFGPSKDVLKLFSFSNNILEYDYFKKEVSNSAEVINYIHEQSQYPISILKMHFPSKIHIED
jgi:hypothetical protein